MLFTSLNFLATLGKLRLKRRKGAKFSRKKSKEGKATLKFLAKKESRLVIADETAFRNKFIFSYRVMIIRLVICCPSYTRVYVYNPGAKLAVFNCTVCLPAALFSSAITETI